MRTLNEIKKEREDLLGRAKMLGVLSNDDIKEKKKIKSRLTYLKPLIIYLETNPTKEFCQEELKKTQKKLADINGRFCPPDGISGKVIGEFRKSFDAEWGVKKIKTHIKNLKFILK